MALARELIDAVVASFRPVVPQGARPWTPEELGLIERLQEVFVAAGVERVRREHDPERWLQIGVRCADADRFLGERLAPAARRWQKEGLFARFFVMRKPPGLRLRFSGPELEAHLLPEVLDALGEAKRKGTIDGHEFGAYDPETHQFGGEVGVDIAHEHFTRDTFALLELLALRTDFDRATMSLIAQNDLIARITLDPAERWDVWRNMRLAGRLPPLSAERERALREDLEQNRELLLRAIFRPSELIARMGAAEQAIMKAYLQSNEEIAERMRIAAKDGALVYGPRKIMPFLIIFHWNRWGLGASLQVALTFFMDALLCPKGP